MNTIAVETKQLVAIELSEKLLDHIRVTNDEKRLMLKYKQFTGPGGFEHLQGPAAQEEQSMLLFLNEKLQEEPEFAVPHGYKKVSEVVFEEKFRVPQQLGMLESE